MLLLLIPATPAFATALPKTITEDTTLSAAGNPYTGGTTISSGATLTVEPGVVFAEAYFTVNGALKAEGTAEQPVVFEGFGPAAIAFEPGSGASVLDHVEVNHAGHNVCCSPAPAILITKSSPTIRNSTIDEAGYHAIQVKEGGSPEIADNLITDAANAGILYTATAAGNTGQVDIHGNTIEGANAGIIVNTSGSAVTGKTLSTNTVSGTTQEPLRFSGPDIPGDVTQNTLLENVVGLIEVDGTVASSSTWKDGGAPVKLTGSTTIAAAATLKIDPGLYFTETSFVVKGTLLAEGTSEDPIVFNGKAAAALTFEPGSGASVVDHAEVLRAGKTACCSDSRPAILITKSSPTIKNSTIDESAYHAIQVKEGGSPEIAGNQISNTANVAIAYVATAAGNTGEVNIHGNTVNDAYYGIVINTAGSAVTGKTLSANTVTGTTVEAFKFSGPDIPGDITENTLAANAVNLIEVSGTVAHSSTWEDSGVPVKLTGTTTIAATATLKLSPGIYFTEAAFVVKGTLLAEGTSEDPIVFNGKAAAALTFEPGSGASVVDHVDVLHAGKTACCGDSRPAILIKKSSPTIKNSTITETAFRGIEVKEGGSPEIADNEITDSANAGILYTATAAGNTGQVDIHGNTIEGANAGIVVNTSGSAVTGKTLSSNTVSGTNQEPLKFSGPDIPDDVTQNSLSANVVNLIEVDGTVASSSTWHAGSAAMSIAGSVTVASGATLTLAKDVYIINPALIVKGRLVAEGTQSEPIVLTGPKEASSGEWTSIKFEPGSGPSTLSYTEVAYGGKTSGSGMIEVKGSSPKIVNSTIRKSKYYGIKVTESGSPVITLNRFRGNANGLYYNGTGKLSAPGNDWGCASGPSPSGCGDSVNAYVNWQPAATLPELAGHCRGGDSQCGEGADPVSLATGDLSYSHRDLLLTNKSKVPLEFARSYSSGSSADTGLGPGWSQTGLASATELESGEVLIQRQDGRQDLFAKTESGYKAPSGVTSTLTKVEGTFQLTTLERTVYRFDASGRIASITDDHGLKTTYGYDANGRLATITDPSAQTLTFSYNSSNHITLVKDSTGREVKYGYSAAGDLATVTDALGGVTEYTYDSTHRLKTIKDPRGNVILQNTYDGQGRVVEQRDGLENLWTLEYKAGETIVTEPEGGKLTYGFDGQDRVVSEKNQLGHTTTTGYDAAGNIDEIVEPGGARWTFGHDADGNLTSVVDPEEGERTYEYDVLNRLTSFTDERGETWSYEWDEGNDLVKVTDPAEGETTFTHDAAGLPLTLTDPDEHTTTFTYDARGNRLTAKDALENTTAYAYNNRNQLISKTEPGLKAETYGRNALGDLLSTTTPEGSKTEYAYDANGMPTQVKDPAANLWKIEYNAMERPIAYVDPLERKTEIGYDGNLNQVAVSDRRGKKTSYAYDLANQVTEIIRPEGGDWEFAYDARGNRVEVGEPRENATTYEFDLLNRMTAVDEPLETETSYTYDPASNLTSFTDPRENTTELAYDELGRLTEIDQPLEKTTSFTYDGVGNRLTRTTAAGTLEYGYDAINQLEEISAGESVLRAFDYDPAGRLTGATDAQADEIEVGYDDDNRVVSIDDGRGQAVSREYDSRDNVVKQVDGRGTLEYGYDALNRMTSLTDPQSEVLEFGYDPEGNLTEVELPNGVVTTTEYDDAGRVAAIDSLGPEEAVLESLDYEYDPAGNRVAQVDRLSQETTYAYDALDRLTQFDPPGEGSTAYGYDPAGNRTKAGATTFSFNDLNQLTSASDGTSYDYDDAGRLIEVDVGEAGTTYTWNPLDELISVDTGAQEIDYAYDALGRQASRDDGSAIRLSHYGDLSDLPILDTDEEGEPTMSYVQGPAGLVEQRSGEATSFPLRDAHGDITTLADGEGEVASRQTYDPWGVQLSGPSLEMGWLGAQQRRSAVASGLVQMGIRSYDPTLGRFLTEDPIAVTIGLGQLADRYTYAANTPPNLTDLTGRSIFEDIAEGGGGMVESFVDDPFGYPREMVSNAQEYWVDSESPLSYVAGPAVSMVDLAVNPDRLDYYMKSNKLPQREQLADCYSSGHPARTIGGIAGGAGGFVIGTSSAVGDLGGRAIGVGAVSGAAGAFMGGAVGTLGGCAFGVVNGLVE
ncbi:MAG TPA: right-handed parallel beta-helix repeat-containing protein [Solirubrobacterales bacterium]|nr:right-handed parallel beta-helix repeat-containing protein [Solirubrobacterales bacterium]